MQVKKKKKDTNNATNFSLQVESITQQEIFDYDESRIIKALINEVGCSEETSKKVASEVTTRLQKTGTEVLTPQLIRCFVNVVLCEMGFTKELKSNSEITISTNDIKTLIFDADKNSSNVSHNPEGINLSIAENVIKQYALKTIVPKEIANKHLKGDIHIHDLGMINRMYAFDGELNTINVKDKRNGNVFNTSFKEFSNKLSSLYDLKEKENDEEVKYYDITDFEIEDQNGWTDINRLTVIPEEKDIYEVELEDGKKIYLTEEHCCLKVDENTSETIEIQLKDLRAGDVFYVVNKTSLMDKVRIKSIKKVKKANVVYDITTESHTLVCNDIYTHNCSGHNPEYIKRYGIKNMKNIPTSSAPAGTAWTAVRHMASATMFFTSLFAGAM